MVEPSVPDPSTPLSPLGQELTIFQDALERLLAPELGGLRRQTREIVDWILEGYLSRSLQEKAQAYSAAQHATRETVVRLAADEGGTSPLLADRRLQLRRDLANLQVALDQVLELITHSR